MVIDTCFTARYAETDQMGIVHHSNYPIWFEAGRTEFFRNASIPNSQIEAMGILLPLTHMDCSFMSPAKYEDEIIVKTRIRSMTCARIEFDYQIFNSEYDRLLATGSTSHAWTDKSLIPLNIKKLQPEIWLLLEKAAG
ncbi:MAG: acyl-CoA thioesterase [Clostridia bacterium]|nr:acyl-CoA thioesterase [Clostridia bacterium]